MKSLFYYSGVALIILTVSFSACRKDGEDPIETYFANKKKHLIDTGSLSHIFAGQDIILELPQNETYLNGWYSNSGDVINTISWFKINGPESYAIENNNALRTRVSSLEKGFYQFELTVINSSGITIKDTVAITVGQLPTEEKEIVFKDVTWTTLWYNAIELKDFNVLLPPGTFFKVFIQRDDDRYWKEVKPFSPDTNATVNYEYFVEDRLPDGAGMYTHGSLYIFYYGIDVSDSPSVKIVY